MTRLKFPARLRGDRRGVTSMEYGVIAVATVTAVAAVMPNIAPVLSSMYASLASAL